MARTVQADLRSYYEAEARLRKRKPLRGRRVELRAEFIELLHQERCRSIVDFGAGPGGDGQAFIDAGLHFVGIDLAHGNGRLAAEEGVTVVQASLGSPPFAASVFDAGWSMSALMHLPESEARAAATAMARSLRPGAPLLVGVWGGEERDDVNELGIPGERRLFSYRPADLNADILAGAGQVEHRASWDVGMPDEHYQVFLVRVAHEN